MHSGYESFSRPQPKAMDRVRRDTLALGSHGGHQTSVDMLLAAEEEAMVRVQCALSATGASAMTDILREPGDDDRNAPMLLLICLTCALSRVCSSRAALLPRKLRIGPGELVRARGSRSSSLPVSESEQPDRGMKSFAHMLARMHGTQVGRVLNLKFQVWPTGPAAGARRWSAPPPPSSPPGYRRLRLAATTAT